MSGELIYVIEQLKEGYSALLKVDDHTSQKLYRQTGIDRNRIIEDLAKDEADLEKCFSGLENIIGLLKRGEE